MLLAPIQAGHVERRSQSIKGTWAPSTTEALRGKLSKQRETFQTWKMDHQNLFSHSPLRAAVLYHLTC